APRRAPVDISIAHGAPAKTRGDVLVVGVFTDGALPPAAREIDDASSGRLRAVLERGDLESRAGSSLLVYDVPGTTTSRVLLVSLGRREEWGDKAFRDALAGAANALGHARASEAVVTLADEDVPGRPLDWRVQHATRILLDGTYRFDAPKAANGDGERGVRGVVL